MTLDTGASNAFSATGGGTVNVTGTNHLTTTTGTALNVVNTTIGSSNITFQSISATTVSGNAGIILNGTGSSGGLIVTGTDGPDADTIADTGTGGTITSRSVNQVQLTDTKNVSLSGMIITSGTAEGITGVNVNGITLSGTQITNNGTAAADEGINLRDTTGSITFTSVTATGNHNSNVQITTSAASTAAITSLTVIGGTFSNSATNVGLLVDLHGSASLATATIDGATFSGDFSKGIQFQQNDNAVMGNSVGTAPNGAITVTNSTFTNNNVAASFEGGGGTGGTGSAYYRFVNNMTITGSHSHAVNFANGSDSGGGTYKALISGNIIGNAAVAGSGSAIGDGLRVFMQGEQDATIDIENNTIRQVPLGRGIDVSELGRPGANHGQTLLDVKIVGNNVNPQDTSGFPLYAIYVGADAQGTGTSGSNVHAEIHGNTVPTTSAFDTQANPDTGMIVYETVNGATGTTTGTLFNFNGSGSSVSNEIATTNTGTAGKTTSYVNGGSLTLTGTPVTSVPLLGMPPPAASTPPGEATASRRWPMPHSHAGR
jgi:hypothetical protein